MENQPSPLSRQQRFRKIGLLLFIAPIATLVTTLVLTAVLTYVGSTLTGSGLGLTIVQILRVLVGFIATIATIVVLPGIPTGIILLGVSRRSFEGPADPRSGHGPASTLPIELKGWNWGAAGLTWLWGASHNVWFSFLSFIPGVGIFFWIILGIKGNEWAWQSMSWASVEQFKAVQNSWKVWGIVVIILRLLPLILATLFFSTISSFLLFNLGPLR